MAKNYLEPQVRRLRKVLCIDQITNSCMELRLLFTLHCSEPVARSYLDCFANSHKGFKKLKEENLIKMDEYQMLHEKNIEHLLGRIKV